MANRQRDEVFTIPVTKNEKQNIKKAAEEMGVTMSAFARIVLKDFMKKGERT